MHDDAELFGESPASGAEQERERDQPDGDLGGELGDCLLYTSDAADECQIHHLDPWLHGGLTNIANLSTACAYHNGANDDDPNAPPLRGRLARENGQIRWQPPDC